MTKEILLLGYPLGHSISPAFQQAALDFLHLDIRYRAEEVTPERLAEVVSSLRRPPMLGANVTIPHKEAVIPLLDELDEQAAGIGAVNTIVNRQGSLVGYNTDARGFIAALRSEGHFEPAGKRVALLGAGGAARAVCFALLHEKVTSLTIINRTHDRAEALASSLRSAAGKRELTVSPWQKMRQALAGVDLIVNSTSIGMKHTPTEGQSPVAAASIPGDALIFDLVYNPPHTALRHETEQAGARYLGGLPMLVYQGAASFELWLQRAAPLAQMMAAAQSALQQL